MTETRLPINTPTGLVDRLTTRKRILVMGATGFVGRALVPALVADGHDVTAHGRQPVSEATLAGLGVSRHVFCDFEGACDFERMLRGHELVIHLAGVAHQDKTTPYYRYERINVAATQEIARAAAVSNIKVIFVSSIAAQVGVSSTSIVSEADEQAPTTFYGGSKRLAEVRLLESGANYVVIRPPLIVGAGAKGNFAELLKLAARPVPLPFGGLEARRSLLSIDNLIAAIKFLIGADHISKQTFIVADAIPLRVREMIASSRKGMGMRPLLFPVPDALLSASFSMLGRKDALERISSPLVVSPQKIVDAGFRHVTTSSRALEATGAWYINQARGRLS